jgi:SAM-dependent methyltransferase
VRIERIIRDHRKGDLDASSIEAALYENAHIGTLMTQHISANAAGPQSSISQIEIPKALRKADHIYRYPAKMTPRIGLSFISKTLEDSECEPIDLAFHDPMCGSGTTSLIAKCRGLKVTSSDIMPTSVQVARAKVTRLHEDGLEALDVFKDMSIISSDATPVEADEWPTWNTWYTPCVLRALEDIRDAIDTERRKLHFAHLMVALFKTAWDVSAADKGVIVPTLGKYGNGPPKLKPSEVREVFRDHIECFIGAQEALRDLGIPAERSSISQGDALDISSWPIKKPDIVLTSPPYGCGLDYARALGLQMRIWSPNASTSEWSCKMLGRRNYIYPDEASLPSTITKEDWFLTLSVKSPTRLALLVQYLNDMSKFFHIARRRLADGGRLGIVIGNPEVARIRVPLNEVVRILAEDAGLRMYGLSEEDRIKSRVQNLRLRSASAPIQSEYLLTFGM